MKSVLAKTFGGLSTAYYFRQLFFGLLFPIFLTLILSQGNRHYPMVLYVLIFSNTLIYPYSRFTYESVAGFLLGRNQFVVSLGLMLGVKIFTMLMCWGFAIAIAPIGLAYLYYVNSKTAAVASV